ncbi:hypothetical protein MMC29_006113 [Sticta canariensis]|nr:hypothetical protein [Sticta canariensis]
MPSPAPPSPLAGIGSPPAVENITGTNVRDRTVGQSQVGGSKATTKTSNKRKHGKSTKERPNKRRIGGRYDREFSTPSAQLQGQAAGDHPPSGSGAPSGAAASSSAAASSGAAVPATTAGNPGSIGVPPRRPSDVVTDVLHH